MSTKLSRYLANYLMWFWGGLLSIFLVVPLWRPGYLVHRDMVSVPTTFFTNFTLGWDGSAGRAAPQEWLLAVLSHFWDGGLVVKGLLSVFLGLIMFYADRLVRVFWDYWLGSLFAAPPVVILVTRGLGVFWMVYNPWVGERLLQGQWSLLAAAVGVLAVTGQMIELQAVGRMVGFQARVGFSLSGYLALAAITPSGWLIMAIFIFFAMFYGRFLGSYRIFVLVILGVTALPWLWPSCLVDFSAASGTGVELFAARAENFSGVVGSVLSWGGFWNVGAMPVSRANAGVALAGLLVVFLIVLGVGWFFKLVKSSGRGQKFLVLSGLIGVGFPVLFSLPGLQAVQIFFTKHVPALGIFRDTQKLVILAAPLYLLGLTVAVAKIVQLVDFSLSKSWVAGLTGLLGVGLIFLNVPDLGSTLSEQLAPQAYGRDWWQVRDILQAKAGVNQSMYVLPRGLIRDFPQSGVVVDPALRFFPVNVVQRRDLWVDGRVAEGEGERKLSRLEASLLTDTDSSTRAVTAALAELGIQWILWEKTSAGFIGQAPAKLASFPLLYQGNELALYQVNPLPPSADADTAGLNFWQKFQAHGTHILWLICLLLPVLKAYAFIRFSTQTARRIS